LRLLRDPASAAADAGAALIERLDRPRPRVAQGLTLRGRAHACIDVSDGLVADLGHICKASGVGAEIDLANLPASAALRGLFDDDARAPLQLAGGDDYELCFTAATSAATELLCDLAHSGCAATRIGRIVAKPGVRVFDAGGRCIELPRVGWQHFVAK
jgi:thiamine-monophosphate kinase